MFPRPRRVRRPRLRKPWRILPVALAIGLPVPGRIEGQVATVRIEENFRAEPNGTVVGRVVPGTGLPVARVRGNWVETELEGWVWARSLQVADRNGLDLVVSADGGENLRAEPQGRIRARLAPGALLDELERRPGWIRVRRVGWIWQESVDLAEAPAPDGAAPDEAVPDEMAPEPAVADPDDGQRAPAAARPPAEATVPASAGGPEAIVTAPASGLAVLSAPDGDTLALARPGRDLPVLGRRGGWARVRVEGWTWVGTGPVADGDSAGRPVDLDVEAVLREPARHRGRLVRWTLQFVSLERAERVRTDFYEGEPFLLTRPTTGAPIFVYVAVPPDRVPELEELTPLDPVEVVGRIRTGASGLTGSPILDLVELRRPRR